MSILWAPERWLRLSGVWRQHGIEAESTNSGTSLSGLEFWFCLELAV